MGKPFIGREWVKDQVDAWLDHPGRRICFVYGDPGIGKSAFAAHYTHYNRRVAAAIFCDYGNTQFNHPKAVIQTLAFLLACRLSDYRLSLAEALDHADDLGQYNESELFDLLLAQPLTTGTIDGNRETMCILIDGLDESGDRDRNALTEVLIRYADRLPRWLRILAFSRRVESITGLSRGSDTIDLTGGLEKNKADVRAYFEDCLSTRFGTDENYADLIRRLAENSGGIFLYATLMVDALAKGMMSISDIDSVPEGLDSAFKQWFQWFFPDIREYEKDWQMPLACIAASPEPIPEEELRIVFGWTNTKLNWLKHTLEVLLRRDVNDFRKETLQLSHRYISEWLFSDAAGRFQVDREDAYREMGTVFLEIFEEDPEKLSAYEAYYIRDYADTIPRRKNRELLLDGRLHNLVIRYGDYARTWSKYDTAIRYFRLSKELASSEDPEINGLGRSNRYGRSLSREGGMLERLGQYKEALQLYQKGLELREKICSERGTMGDLRDLSVSCNKVAGIYKKQSMYEEALKLYQKGLELREKLASGRRTIDDLRDLSVSCNNVGSIYEIQSRHEEALELYQKGLELKEKICSERGTMDDLRDLSVSCNNVGSIYEKQSRYEEALELYQKGLELREKICSERGTMGDLRDLSVSCNKVGSIYAIQIRHEEALELYHKGLELREKLASERGTMDDLRDLSISCNNVGSIYEKQSRYEEALELYQKGLELREKLVSERGIMDDLQDLSVSYENVAGIYEKQNKYEEALELYQKGMELRKKVVTERGTMDDLQGLSVSYLNIGGIFERKDRLEAALELYQKGLELREKVVTERGTMDDLHDLFVSRNKVAGIYEKQSRYDDKGRHIFEAPSTAKLFEQVLFREDLSQIPSLHSLDDGNNDTSTSDEEDNLDEFLETFEDVINDIATSEDIISKVQFHALAPSEIKKNDFAIVKILMLNDGDLDRLEMIKKSMNTDLVQNGSSIVFSLLWAEYTIILSSQDISIDNPCETIKWNGIYACCDFYIYIPEDYKKSAVRLQARVYRNNIALINLKLIVKVKADTNQPLQDLIIEKQRILSAFLSYSSKDTEEVAQRIQGMLAVMPDLEYFWDVVSLHRGEYWETRLYDEIRKRDIFYLFWSNNARSSEWVEKELSYAVKIKGLDFIEPIPLEDPQKCPPPEILAGKHFNDWILRYVKAQQ